MTINKTAKKSLKLKKSLKGLKINKRIKKNYTKKNKLFKKTGGSRNSKVYKKIRHRKMNKNKNKKFTRKMRGGKLLTGIKLFINHKERELKSIEPIESTKESVESILNTVGEEGKINGLYINGMIKKNDLSKLTLEESGISEGSIIRVVLDKSGVNNVPKSRIPHNDFKFLEELKEPNDSGVDPRKFNQKYWDQVRAIIQDQFGGVEINPESQDIIFVGIGSGRQYMYNETNIDDIYYKKYSHNNKYAPTNVQQLPPILRDKNKDNLEDLRYDQRIFVINMDRDINSYNNEPVLLSYLKLKYGDELFDNFKDKIITEHEKGKGGRRDNDILIHTLLDDKIIFISLKCNIELDEKNRDYPLNIIRIDPKNPLPHHDYFQT